ncbi:MAG: precorrin-4 C(11)-methyltransferase [Eubacteriales bacterium]|jgi:precorrin-4/cobalt-precorrin-4 C11-methyltransferase|nr:precorrin-4 C(11)-methyltransferase [Pseudomonadota bacterium]MBU4532567.1 precorrin-4 C(11)-methyltransferase [Bacillota bacterium]MBV1728512.1 precorrin-4 C(11)-methyltransferase [Desulforudis sp.]MDQ7789356.1 precorrin-4 C(11)-methyltransferase [Clostridia bacterium]MDZ4042583.1 precorrin-4 C(11)-methyltransferase [Eubacteriales bacterium]
MTVYFIGAGPGDPELITVKGRRLLEQCPVVIYAGSLVNPEVLRWAQADAAIHDSSKLNLDVLLSLMNEAHATGRDVARLHTGDPSLYGAIAEQIRELRRLGIPYEIVPGVSACFAAAAALGVEYTLPGGTQTLILTRRSGRTPVPESESLPLLAQAGAAMVLYLSVGDAERVQGELLVAYGPDCPVAVVYRATWPDQEVLRCRLSELAETVRTSGLKRHALILVGSFLDQDGLESYLYSKERTQDD